MGMPMKERQSITRTDHRGEVVQVDSPISNKPIDE